MFGCIIGDRSFAQGRRVAIWSRGPCQDQLKHWSTTVRINTNSANMIATTMNNQWPRMLDGTDFPQLWEIHKVFTALWVEFFRESRLIISEHWKGGLGEASMLIIDHWLLPLINWQQHSATIKISINVFMLSPGGAAASELPATDAENPRISARWVVRKRNSTLAAQKFSAVKRWVNHG